MALGSDATGCTDEFVAAMRARLNQLQPPAGANVDRPDVRANLAALATAVYRVLTADGHAGARYRVTGPAALTQAEQVAVIGAALGRRLRFVEVPPELARERMLRRLPAPIVDGLLDIFAAATTRPAEVLPTVEEVTGRPARTYAEWAADHRKDFQ